MSVTMLGTRGACPLGGGKVVRHGSTSIILVPQRVVNSTVFDGSLRSRWFCLYQTTAFDSTPFCLSFP